MPASAKSRPPRAGGRYLPREAGALAFNRRVFAQAADRHMPLLERLRFLCIVSSNLDELFEIRVAELKERIKLGNEPVAPGELPPSDVLREVSQEAHALVYRTILDANHFDHPYGIPALPRLFIRDADPLSYSVHLPWNQLIGEGLLAFSNSGILLGANYSAIAFFGIENHEYGKVMIEQLVDVNFDQLLMARAKNSDWYQLVVRFELY